MPDLITASQVDHRPFKRSLELVARHRLVFEHLSALAERYHARGRYSAAATVAQLAAAYAWHNHTGGFVSSRLETLLKHIGTLKVNRPVLQRSVPSDRERVLHVLTQAYKLGGHTRLVWRWINQDRSREHTAVLTHQELVPVPSQLTDAIVASGGKLIVIDRKPGDLIRRSQRLRKLVSRYDYVILHIHPFDVVPLLAFARSEGVPPVILLNHADHVFWLGVGVANLVASIRASGAALAVNSRGVVPSQTAIVPIPMDPVIRRRSQAEARHGLGLPETTVVLLTVASSYKYTPLSYDGLHIIDVLEPIFRSNPNVLLLAVGPDASSPQWATAVHRTGLADQIRAVGRQQELAAFYEAADIYLDSFPFASLTSTLEAMSFGIPAVALALYREKAAVLYSDGPGFDTVLFAAETVDDYRREINRLISNPELRFFLGNSARQSIEAIHLGSGWQQLLESTYKTARTAKLSDTRSSIPQISSDSMMLDVLIGDLHSRSAMGRTEDDLWRLYIRQLPIIERATTFFRLSTRGPILPAGLLLSEWLGNRLAQVLRRGCHE